MVALIALPIAAYVLLSALARRLLRRGGLPSDWPAGLVVGFLLLCGLVAVLTEGLSLFGALAFWPVLTSWVCVVIMLAVAWRLSRGDDQCQQTEQLLPRLSQWKSVGFWLWISAALVTLVALLVALAAPPNTHDALAYHLPRQLRWMDHGAVRHYATNDMRELSFAPLAEYMQMHTLLLVGGDIFVNGVQWVAYALTAMSAGLVCRAVGHTHGAPLAAMLVVCQPVAYLQAASPKNDPVLMFLSVSFAWLGVVAMRTGRCGAFHAGLLGLALGLAVLAKTTALVILFPLCVLIGFVFLWRFRLAALWRGGVIGCLALVVASGFVARNMASFGQPLGPLAKEDGGFSLGMERHDPPALGSNLLRNVALHVPIRTDQHAATVGCVVRSWHDALAWNPDDPRTTWETRYAPEVNIDNEGRAPAPLHVLLVCVAGGGLCVMAVRRRPGAGWSLALWCCGVGAFLLFVATVKWNPWHTRLHTPIIAMLAAPIAVAFWPDRRGAPWRAVPVVIGGCVLVFVAWVAVSNTDRPLFGPNSVVLRPRAESLRWRWPDQQRQVLDAVEGIEDAPSGPVAILANNDDYPVMREILRRDGRRGFTHLYSKLARSATVDPRWQPPAAVVSAYHVRPVVVFNGEFFVRRNEASSLNQYTLVDEPPSRTPGDSIPYFDRYHAFADPSKPDRTGRMAQYHAGHRTVYGLILPVSGLVVTVPGDGEARTLLLALNPLAQDEVGVRISLGEQLLLEAPNLQIAHYTAFELPIPASPEPSKLSITFSSPANDSATDAAAVGWIQLPTNKQLRAYDRRTRLSQTEPKPN